ncbi:hypothetical protein ACFUGD_01920 [Streptomyces sp. NPDC057217]|uniref:hypothetical protein n=1 Tax=Streptomyces sp. NPDC057217 TaxID=3346054 RepID=UPI00363B5484
MTDQTTTPEQQPTCPGCGHTAHHPGTECDAGVEHGPKRWHRCLCLNLVDADRSCPPQMDCQGGTLGYSDVWHLQRRGDAARQATGQADTTPTRCPDWPNCNHPFMLDGCTCRPWTRQTTPPRYLEPGDSIEMIGGWERGADCPHHAPAPVVGQPAAAPDTDQAHPARTQWVIEWYRAAKGQWFPDQPPYSYREDAVDEIARQRRHQPARPLRLVRETTTWTVEDETRRAAGEDR